MEKKVDVVIVGSGIAGLAAAQECQKEGKSFVILEATDSVGGRAISTTTSNGNTINLGANWLHGRKNDPLLKMAEELGLTIDRNDSASNVVSFCDGKVHDKSFRSRLRTEAAIRVVLGSPWLLNPQYDASLEEFLFGNKVTEGQHQKLDYTRKTLSGAENKDDLSARNAIWDPYEPGGYQIVEGFGELTKRLADKIGREHIHLNTPVTEIRETDGGAHIQTASGDNWVADKVLFTGSVGVIHSGKIAFKSETGDSLFSKQLNEQLSHLKMGNMAKMIWEVDESYFKQRPQLRDRHIDFFDVEPPMFCHVNSAGKPTITVFLGGNDAVEAENLAQNNRSKFQGFTSEVLKKVTQLGSGLDDLVPNLKNTEPIITSWHNQPYTIGAYSNCTVGGKRTGPVQAGNNVILCGEAFAGSHSCYIGGAWESGIQAAKMAMGKAEPKWYQSITGVLQSLTKGSEKQ